MASSTWRLVSIGLFVCLALAFLFKGQEKAGGADGAAPQVQAGRYQPFKTSFSGDFDSGECLLDTATGKLWVLENHHNDKPRSKWVQVADQPK
jgi:hypothetical protein